MRESLVMRPREHSILSEILPPEERVIEAVVARYQRVAPAVTRFARSLAGNDELRVRLGAEASAGANDVVLDPGVFQAAYARSAPVTPEEVALASALHEVVHLISTDFEDRRPIPGLLAARRNQNCCPMFRSICWRRSPAPADRPVKLCSSLSKMPARSSPG